MASRYIFRLVILIMILFACFFKIEYFLKLCQCFLMLSDCIPLCDEHHLPDLFKRLPVEIPRWQNLSTVWRNLAHHLDRVTLLLQKISGLTIDLFLTICCLGPRKCRYHLGYQPWNIDRLRGNRGFGYRDSDRKITKQQTQRERCQSWQRFLCVLL